MRFQTINPATGHTVREFETIGSQEASEMAKRAKEAFVRWSRLEVGERAAYMRRLAEALRKGSADYAHLMTLEMGKPITQSKAEVEKCAWTAEVYAENGERWLEDEIVKTDSEQSRVAFQPLGLVLSIMPWNFPFWQALRFAVPSLLAGNVTILRHSNVVPECALAIEDAFKGAGFPDHVFSTAITDHAVVAELISGSHVDAVSVTGSVEVGTKIAEAAAKNLKKVVLELGGSDAFVVLEDADIPFAGKGAAQGRLINSGQSCIAAKRFVVVESVAEEFTRSFVEAMGRARTGDPEDEKTEVGPLVREEQVSEVEAQVEDAVAKGAKLLLGGKRPAGSGFFYPPTVLGSTTPQMRVIREEVFGPVGPVIVAKDADHAVRIANDSEFGLGASVWSTDEKAAWDVARRLEAGAVFINSIVKSDPRMPFGGVKKSGIGRELSKYGLKEFVNVKSINVYRPPKGFRGSAA